MKNSNKKLPKKPRSHEIGNVATRKFDSQCSAQWVTNSSKEDYGWDRLITLTENGQVTGKSFFVQIKGSDSPEYINGKFLSHSIKVSTINFLLDFTIPSMICVCDTSKKNTPIYWEWIQEAIRKVEVQNPEWQKQKTISILLPTSQILDEGNHNKIEEYVKKFHENISIQKEIGSIIIEPYRLTDEIHFPNKNYIQTSSLKNVYSHLENLGLIEITKAEDRTKVESLSKKDQEIHTRIKESSSFLKSFHDREAEKILFEISKEIKSSTENIKAKYYNNLGVLALHNNNKQKAKENFSRAHRLQPNNIKFLTNLLYTEYELALDSGNLKKNIPSDWEKKLDSVLYKDKDYSSAIFLKAHWLSNIAPIRKATELIKNSKAWKANILEPYIALANIFLGKGQFDKALKLFEEIERLNLSKDERYWSTYGNILFIKSIGIGRTYPEMILKGPGPSSINRDYLIKAEKCYDKALAQFKEKGMPKIAEQTIANHTTVLHLLGKYKKCEQICKLYLDYNSESIPVIENLVSSLAFQDSRESLSKAVQYAQYAFKLQSSSTRVYCNLILSLLSVEEFEEIINLVSAREKQGFIDKEEEGLSRTFLAISFNELGYSKESKQQIDLMNENSNLIVDATLAEAEIAKRNNASQNKTIDILKKALKKKKDDPRLLTKIAQILRPINKNNAKEIISCLTKVIDKRQLIPGEYSLLGKAFLKLDEPEKAHEILYRAIKRYPEELQLIYLTAISLYEIGREIDAYTCLKEYMKRTGRNYYLLRNLAKLAANIGKLSESIELFENALHETENSDEKAEIHCILFELKIRLERPKKEILKHVVEFGNTIESDVEAEARFLMMFLIAPQLKNNEIDYEVESWIKEFNERLNKFSEKYPDYTALKTIKIPDNIPDEEKGQYILAQLAYITLPQRLAISPFKLAIESRPWPLAFRAQFLPEAHSIFNFWSICTNSDKFSHAIHILRYANNLSIENLNATENNDVCVDINALLTLAEFGMLDSLSKCFNKIILARGTKIALDMEFLSIFKTHPLLEKIEQWRLNNLRKIRIRNFKSYEWKKENSNETIIEKKLIIPRERNIDELIGDGVGESLLLAKKIGCPLYSDDSLLREWGTNNYSIKSFSTLSLLSRLKNEGLISTRQETLLYSLMIKKNFRIIPFQPYHLTNRLEEIVKERTQRSLIPPKNQDLKQDSILGTFLKQFGEPSIILEIRVNLAINWWISILQNKLSIRELIDECMEYISYCISQITKSGILKGIIREENEHNVALLWSLFWWRCNLTDPSLNIYSWLAIKENCKRLFSSNNKLQDKILFKLIPKYTIKTIKAEITLNETEKIEYLLKLTECFKSGESDKDKLELAFRKLNLKFK